MQSIENWFDLILSKALDLSVLSFTQTSEAWWWKGTSLAFPPREAGVDDRLYVLQGVVDRVTYPSLKGGAL